MNTGFGGGRIGQWYLRSDLISTGTISDLNIDGLLGLVNVDDGRVP